MKGEVVMRVQKIDDSTLRIFLSFGELEERNISMVDLFQRSTQTEESFCEMIAKAGEEVEFILDSPFWIQAQVTSGDEFVITVMKQDSLEETEEISRPKPKVKKNTTHWIYRFEDWEQLVALAETLQNCSIGKNSVYYLAPAYYLVLGSRGITGTLRQRVEAQLKEYGEKLNLSKVYLEEHAKVILAKDALSVIRQHFIKQ